MLLAIGLAAQEGVPGITVRLLNPAGIPPKTMQRAQQDAAGIFAQAGIRITWRQCPPCAEDLAPHERWLHLLTQGPPHWHGDAMGFALLFPDVDAPLSYGGVFWQAVEQAAAAMDVDVAALLGAAMAHELGHILLRSADHADAGVMRARLQKTEARMAGRGELRFTLRQSEKMRAGLALAGV
jgi:hypothetical protein